MTECISQDRRQLVRGPMAAALTMSVPRRTAVATPAIVTGTLEAARVDAEGRVRWLPVPDPLALR